MTACSTNTCGMGGWGGPLPGDPDNNSVLTATPAFGGIDVSWSYPAVNPFAVAHTLLFRGLTSDFNSAYQIAVVSGSQYYDKAENNQLLQYFYWIKIVSVNGTVGELIGPASAMARPTIEVVLEQLAGRIDAGTLAQSLKTEIDRITLNAQAITQESSARVSANNAYSVLMTQVQAGVDGAYSVLNQEIIARQAGDSSLVSQINTAQSVLGNSIATAQTTLQTNIDTVDGKADAIGALYTAKVVTELSDGTKMIGGFGIYNDGTTVDAGFDVNRFWVGKPAGGKKYPFIISGGEVFIDQAVINELTFTKLRDESGSVMVADGKLKAQYLKVSTASIDDAAITSAKIDSLAVTSAKIQDASITAAKIGNAEVSTLKIAGQAVTVPVGSYAAGLGATATLTLPTEAAGQPVSLIVTWYYQSISWFRGVIKRNGVTIFDQRLSRASGGVNPIMPLTATFIDTPPVGTHTYTVSAYYDGDSAGQGVDTEATALYAILSKR